MPKNLHRNSEILKIHRFLKRRASRRAHRKIWLQLCYMTWCYLFSFCCCCGYNCNSCCWDQAWGGKSNSECKRVIDVVDIVVVVFTVVFVVVVVVLFAFVVVVVERKGESPRGGKRDESRWLLLYSFVSTPAFRSFQISHIYNMFWRNPLHGTNNSKRNPNTPFSLCQIWGLCALRFSPGGSWTDMWKIHYVVCGHAFNTCMLVQLLALCFGTIQASWLSSLFCPHKYK